MTELEQAIEIAVGLHGAITRNDSGFIACFSDALTAESYIVLIEEFESLTADRQDRCVVVIKVSSLM
ncbi:hypothetical protein N836_14795 [Leptolyngbya sp. Heron Island J]|uniref:hypothetical protein n=1 Tax=Leptolyngbya sp. Heron Island J TaxID=1385935 RepID=UPI0003B9EAF6|nr:hypothetical protein [Leptolyngbya sp. Heron Island J]ESA35024.1 hypothetical protein N836_14795 [Leptolyngbya sp. Heron Island J]